VLVQTLAPEAPAIRHAASHDAAGFLAGEIERRRALRYPPFSHLVRVELTSADPEPVQRAAEQAADGLRRSIPDGAELLGPAPRFRLRGRHRRQLLVKATEREGAVVAVRGVVDRLAAKRALRQVTVAVDVDPQ
jgi:primosomal protein N' (replication factor Y)